jgi:hypothetical protein
MKNSQFPKYSKTLEEAQQFKLSLDEFKQEIFSFLGRAQMKFEEAIQELFDKELKTAEYQRFELEDEFLRLVSNKNKENNQQIDYASLVPKMKKLLEA